MSERWTLLTSHGHVLFYLAAERRVVAVLHDLEAAGMVRATKMGNRKHYEVNPDAKFRHPTLSHVALRDVLGQLRMRASGPPPLRWRR